MYIPMYIYTRSIVERLNCRRKATLFGTICSDKFETFI